MCLARKSHRLILLVLFLIENFALAATPDVQAYLENFTANVQKATLSNGIRVLIYRRGYAPVFSGIIGVRVGGSDEIPGQTGIAHMLEHMAFKGTTTIGTKNFKEEKKLLDELEDIAADSDAANSLTPEQKTRWEELHSRLGKLWKTEEFSRQYERRGSTGLNATTDSELTKYMVSLPRDRFEFWCAAESDKLVNPVFRQFYQERDVVLEEQRMRSQDDPTGKLFEQFFAIAFLAHPYRQPVIGYFDDISHLTAAKLKDFAGHYYVPDNIVIALVGDVSPEKDIPLMEKYFGKIPSAPVVERSLEKEAPQEGERRFVLESPASRQVLIGYKKPQYPDPEDPKITVMYEILGNSKISPLYTELVQKKKLVTSISVSEEPGMAYPNLIIIQANTRAPHTNQEVLSEIDRVIGAFIQREPTEEELSIEKRALTMSYLGDLKSNMTVALNLVTAELVYNDWRLLLKWYSQAMAVTAQDVKEVAQKYLIPAKRTVAFLETKQGDAKPNVAVQDAPVALNSKAAQSPMPSEEIISPLSLSRNEGNLSGESSESEDEKEDRIPIDSKEMFTQPQVRRWTLPNGLEVVFLHDTEVPIVRGTLFLRGGLLWESVEENGVVGVMGHMLRAGGAGSRGAEEMDRILETLSASILSSYGSEYGSVNFVSLSQDIDTVMGMLSDVVQRPRFEESRLQLVKLQLLEKIKRRIDDPATVASIAVNQLVYGDTPYGRTIVSNDVMRFSRGSIQKAFKNFVSPSGAILVVAGNIEEEDLSKLVAKHFGGWAGKSISFDTPPPIPDEPKPGIYFIRLPISQAVIHIGQLGVPRFTPDWYDIGVFDEVFGSGNFGCRLIRELRSNAGLAYMAYGGILPGLGKGMNFIMTQSKATSAGPAIAKAIEVLKGLQKDGPSDVELNEAKNSMANSYVFKFDTPLEVVQRNASLELMHYPANYDESYLANILAVSKEGVERVAQKRWDTSRLVMVVVGNDAAAQSIRSLLSGPLNGYNMKEVAFREALLQ